MYLSGWLVESSEANRTFQNVDDQATSRVVGVKGTLEDVEGKRKTG